MHMKRYFSCGLLLLILLVIALLAGRYGTNLQDMLAALCFMEMPVRRLLFGIFVYRVSYWYLPVVGRWLSVD